MNTDELQESEQLYAAVAVLKQGQHPVHGLAQRALARAHKQKKRRVWLTGSAGIFGTLALTLILTQRGGQMPDGITFALVAPTNANGISVVGDFNDWDAARNKLQPKGHDKWQVTIKLSPGRYRFAYVTDEGEWLADPDAPPTTDPFGEPTSVLTVPAL